MSSELDPFDTLAPVNPYAPTSNGGPTYFGGPEVEDVEACRRAHLNHEASIKSIGFLYLLGAIFMVPMGVGVLIASVGGLMASRGQDASAAAATGTVGLLYLCIGVFQGYTGLGLRKVKSWARRPGIVLSVIGLLAFPIGTLISAYFLYLLLSEKGKVIMSPLYQDVIAQTPHIKYKTSIVVWILLGLVIALITLAVIGAVVSGPR